MSITMSQPLKRVRRGPGRPAQSENRDTRGEILRAAEKLFAATGFEATSLRQIAAEAYVDLATVKYHFGDKVTLYDDAYQRGHTRFVEYFEGEFAALGNANTRDELKGALDHIAQACIAYCRSERNFIRLALFRVLEGAETPARHADQMRTELFEKIAGGLDATLSRELTKRVDMRALVSYLAIGIPMWLISNDRYPELLGLPNSDPDAVDARALSFVQSLLHSVILAPE